MMTGAGHWETEMLSRRSANDAREITCATNQLAHCVQSDLFAFEAGSAGALMRWRAKLQSAQAPTGLSPSFDKASAARLIWRRTSRTVPSESPTSRAIFCLTRAGRRASARPPVGA